MQKGGNAYPMYVQSGGTVDSHRSSGDETDDENGSESDVIDGPLLCVGNTSNHENIERKMNNDNKDNLSHSDVNNYFSPIKKKFPLLDNVNFHDVGVNVGVGVGVDLNLDIDKAISETFQEYNSVDGFESSKFDEAQKHTIDSSLSSPVVIEPMRHSFSSTSSLTNQPKVVLASQAKETNESRDSSFTNDGNVLKRTCQFCGKTFQHAGSLGRHLDTQKGKAQHPADDVERIRSGVARRGDPEAIRIRKQERAREYNRREYVKEKNRQRRKFTSRISRVRESYQLRFCRKLGNPLLTENPTFADSIVFFLPPFLWPDDEIPDETTQQVAYNWIFAIDNDLQTTAENVDKSSKTNEQMREKLKLLNNIESEAFQKLQSGQLLAEWLNLNVDVRADLWKKAQRRALCSVLGEHTVFDFAARDRWIKHLMEVKKAEVAARPSGDDEYSNDSEDQMHLLGGFDSLMDMAGIAEMAEMDLNDLGDPSLGGGEDLKF